MNTIQDEVARRKALSLGDDGTATLGRPYDVPRICPLCERRMVVKISPMGWEAACSRHGLLRSEWLES